VLATAAIADSWKGGQHLDLRRQPDLAAAANATIDVITSEQAADNAAAMGKVLREGLDALQKKYAGHRRRARQGADAGRSSS
jgi:4-aminobutyrate aminotransferase-like enzyme